MPTNQYHLLHFIPATESWEMPRALEALAEQLVRSGKLRISTEHTKNFVRMGTSDSDETFTARELADPALAALTRARVARHVAPAEGADGIQRVWDQLLRDLKVGRGVSAEKEMKVARVLVQAAHPAVVQLLLISGTEIFVSYAHSVADLMQVRDWDGHGANSGLQATETNGTQVFISAGGDPFFEGEQKTYTTDGFPALARMVVIAGQEFGHFADLRRQKRSNDGNLISKTRQNNADFVVLGLHSVDHHHSQLRAAPVAANGRNADMKRVNELKMLYFKAGLANLRRSEGGVAFYHTRYKFTPPWIIHNIYRLVRWSLMVLKCRQLGIYYPLKTHPYHRFGDALELFLGDMAFNLAPEADVYRDPDPLVEEAIAVIEAVARVPQQVHKWGHDAVKAAWPNLYAFYYGTIIPANQAVIDNRQIGSKISLIQKLVIFIHRFRRKRPGYYP